MMTLRETYELFQETFNEWTADKAPRMGAALAYYSVFSIAPLILLAVAAAGLVFGREAAETAIVDQLQSTVGRPVAKALAQMVQSAEHGPATVATIIGFVILFFGASGVFGELQDALNTIWKVKPKPGRPFLTILRERFLSFTMVVGTGFLLLVSLIISAALSAVAKYLTSGTLPGGVGVWQVVNWLVSLAFISLVFALIYKVVPDVKVPWRGVLVGGLLAALLFTLGKYLLGLYLGRASTTSAYGAAGSLVVVLIWVYYSAQILLFGAEFTRVFARQFHEPVQLAENAVNVTPGELARQGVSSSANPVGAPRAPEPTGRHS